jgi:hypothetical protein
MHLDNKVADGFMSTADMRDHVVIVQKRRKAARDYDQIGFVRVGKLLQMPSMGSWKEGKFSSITKSKEEGWVIAINDQELADHVTRTGTGHKAFDGEFVTAFRTEVNDGLKNFLRREKLLNGGHYNLGFFEAYQATLGYDAFVFPIALTTSIALGDNPVHGALTVIGAIAAANFLSNGLNLAGAGLTHIREKYRSFLGDAGHTPHYNDPFIKHSFLELVMPPVPVDRLVRGLVYLRNHGDTMLTLAPKPPNE